MVLLFGPVRPAPLTTTSLTVAAADPPLTAIWNDSNSLRAAVSNFVSPVEPTDTKPGRPVSPMRTITLEPNTATDAGVAADEGGGDDPTTVASSATSSAARRTLLRRGTRTSV